MRRSQEGEELSKIILRHEEAILKNRFGIKILAIAIVFLALPDILRLFQ